MASKTLIFTRKANKIYLKYLKHRLIYFLLMHFLCLIRYINLVEIELWNESIWQINERKLVDCYKTSKKS